jgi:CRP-like cAMP-binding protein
MSAGISADGTSYGNILDWLYEQGKQRGNSIPEFDVEKTLSRTRAARDAGAVNFWSALSSTERGAFESAAQVQTYPAGTALMREGEQAGEVMVILDGWTKVCLDEDGREWVIANRGPGDLVGERGTLPGNVRSATVTAVDSVRALVMKTAAYTSFISEHPGVPDLVKKQIYDRLIDRPDPSGSGVCLPEL